ncbi:MAG TPA: EboA domain-containing protein [Streptosporangiaceae bacterium]
MTSDDLARALIADLPAAAARWLDMAGATVVAVPEAMPELFPAVGRCCGRHALRTECSTIRGWTVDDAVRCLLLSMMPLPTSDLLEMLRELYSAGDAAERRGVLRALPLLDERPDFGAGAVPIVADAIRANDPRLISAALSEYAARYLDNAGYRQAVLKCVFCGIPLTDVAGVRERTDAELVRALMDYVREREIAGRDVPADVRAFIEHSTGRTRARANTAP